MLKLSRLVDLTAEITGRSFSYNAQEIGNISVTLRVPGGLTRENLPALLDHVLASRGFTTVRTPGSDVLSVVKIEQAAALSAVTPPQPPQPPQPPRDPKDGVQDGKRDDARGEAAEIAEVGGGGGGAGFVTELIEARHQSAKSLAEAARLVLSKPGGVATVLGDTDLIAVSDLSPRVAEVKALIARLDVINDVVTREIPLSNLPAAQLAALATQVLAKRDQAGAGGKLPGDVIPTPDGGSLLLVCPPEVEEQWLALITTLDRREQVETRTYVPRFYAAKDLATLVETTGTTPASGTGVVDERFRVVVDDLTGSLIVTATGTAHDRIADLIERADSQERAPTPVRTYAIRNRPVTEVLATLQQLISAGVLNASNGGADGDGDAARRAVTQGASQSSYREPFPPPTGNTAPARPPEQSVGAQAAASSTGGGSSSDDGRGGGDRGVGGRDRSGRDAGGSDVRSADSAPGLSLTADEATSTLIAIGEARVLDQVEELLKTIDVRQPQLMLEVMLVSLSETEALSLGVELERLGSLSNATTQLSSLFGLSGGSAGDRTAPDRPGFTGAVLNAGEFAVVVRALESINKGNSISNPKLLVTNNQRAVFSSTLQQPITQQTRTGSNDTTFSFGGSESAGTTISVQPQITRGDHLSLTYSIKLSSFVGTSTTAGLPPPKQENSVDSAATIPDGHTVVVGGLELVTDTEAVAQVPILGSIPIIGELFKTRDKGGGRTRFYVFIRANVLRSEMLEDLKYMSGRDIDRIRGLGVNVGDEPGVTGAPFDDGFPEVTPRIIR